MKTKTSFDHIIDIGFILVFLFFCFSIGKYVGRDDGYIAGFIDGYDFYYKSAYFHLRDSLDNKILFPQEVQ